MTIYTSCYKKMLRRHKAPNDVYVKVSRSLHYSYSNIDGIPMTDLIDADWGKAFAPETSLDFYKDNLDQKQMKKFYNWLDKDSDKNYFLLCFEDLDDVYTKTDEEKYPDDAFVKAGKKKKCHRTYLAEALNSKFNLEIVEF